MTFCSHGIRSLRFLSVLFAFFAIFDLLLWFIYDSLIIFLLYFVLVFSKRFFSSLGFILVRWLYGPIFIPHIKFSVNLFFAILSLQQSKNSRFISRFSYTYSKAVVYSFFVVEITKIRINTFESVVIFIAFSMSFSTSPLSPSRSLLKIGRTWNSSIIGWALWCLASRFIYHGLLF